MRVTNFIIGFILLTLTTLTTSGDNADIDISQTD